MPWRRACRIRRGKSTWSWKTCRSSRQDMDVLWFFIFVVCCCSVTKSCLTLCDPMDCTVCQATLSFTNSQSLLKLMYIELVMPSNHLTFCCPLPTVNLSQHQGLFHELDLPIRLSKYWSFSFSKNPSNEYSELISFRIDWFHLPATQGTLKSLIQHHKSKESILQHSVFFMVQHSHPYVILEKLQLWLYGPLLAKWWLCFLVILFFNDL